MKNVENVDRVLNIALDSNSCVTIFSSVPNNLGQSEKEYNPETEYDYILEINSRIYFGI